MRSLSRLLCGSLLLQIDAFHSLDLTEMVDDHFRHDAPLEPIDRRSRTNLRSPFGEGAVVRVVAGEGMGAES